MIQEVFRESFFASLLPIFQARTVPAMVGFGDATLLVILVAIAGHMTAHAAWWGWGRFASAHLYTVLERNKPKRITEVREWMHCYGWMACVLSFIPLSFAPMALAGLFRISPKIVFGLALLGHVGYYSYMML